MNNTFETNNDDINDNLMTDCPEFDESGQILLNSLSFYVEGIVQTPIAVVGVLGNFVACLVLVSILKFILHY
jgi:hypothetical protein